MSINHLDLDQEIALLPQESQTQSMFQNLNNCIHVLGELQKMVS
jgi:hypothetical protein